MSYFGNCKRRIALGFACLATLAAADDVKPLSSCREVERLWMGMEEGVIRPAAYEQVHAEADGYVAVHAKDGQILQKGDAWATLDPEQLDIERRSFEVEKGKQEQQRVKGREDAQEAHLNTSLELHDFEGKRENLVSVSQDAAIPAPLRQRARSAVSKLDERITVLRGKLAPAVLEQNLKQLDEDNTLQIARKKKQLFILEKHSCLVAASAGQLRLGGPLKEKIAAAPPATPLWVKSGDLLGTIVDDRHYEISVSAAGPLLAEIPHDELLVFIQDSQTGKLIAGDYTRTDEVDSGREITRNFIFIIRQDGVDNARQAQGTRNLVHVYRKFPRPYRLVYKKDIAFLAPDVLEPSGWDGLVRHLWPGSKVIQVGPQTIAVEPKDAH